MAEGTCNRHVETAMEKISAQLVNLQQQMALLLPLQQQVEKLAAEVEAGKQDKQPSNAPYLAPDGEGVGDISSVSGKITSTQPIRIDFPRFSGGDPTEWLFKVEQFFSFHQTQEIHKISLISIHLDGAASSWFQWMSHNKQLRSWREFELALKFRFGPSAYDDPQ
ncbi:hypothetical protein NE237_026291 [Protea cynaroides]|uniref:Retrotransposon gag domain-containing protein n=1 Tax=Protea cynaroides TaxID=273540 RepID=A0A9Q0K253_9MAGN|nr:hypothetical protein NE237_026291 [Protea cynaroides]